MDLVYHIPAEKSTPGMHIQKVQTDKKARWMFSLDLAVRDDMLVNGFHAFYQQTRCFLNANMLRKLFMAQG